MPYISVKLDNDSTKPPVFSNLVSVSAVANDVQIDFGVALPSSINQAISSAESDDEQVEATGLIVSTVIMNVDTAKRFLVALKETLEKHEASSVQDNVETVDDLNEEE